MKAANKRFKRMCMGGLLIPFSMYSQTYKEVKTRFDNYLNYRSLEKQVEISPTKIIFYKYTNENKEEDFVLPKDTWATVSELVKFLPTDSSESLYQKIKGQKKLTVYTDKPVIEKNKTSEKPLTGIKI